ncbi:MAG: hypothetical protein AB7I30_14925 [Isosphaeraceae bacterium]
MTPIDPPSARSHTVDGAVPRSWSAHLKHLVYLLLLSWVGFGTGRPATGQISPPSRKLLIEFGWDEPDTRFLREHARVVEATPFDGCVFHAVARKEDGSVENFAWKFWGKTAYSEKEFADAFEDLRAARLERFRHNFLRVNTTPADLDWFDDFGPILNNARLAARLARAGGARGLLFDVESYEGALFDFRKRRDATARSWDDYAAQVRLRGRQVMTAFQEGYPGLTVLLTFGPSLVDRQARRAGVDPRETPDALLVPFVEGMASAREGSTRIIDGYELSYGYREPGQFDDALATIRRLSPKLQAGFGLWLDYDWREKGWNVDDPSRNHFTPEGFQKALRAALERTDEIVWVYTETPRWWTSDGGPAEKLPARYVEAIREARKGLADVAGP